MDRHIQVRLRKGFVVCGGALYFACRQTMSLFRCLRFRRICIGMHLSIKNSNIIPIIFC